MNLRRDTTPRTSWWATPKAQTDREAFDRQAAVEREAMQVSRFGQGRGKPYDGLAEPK